MALDPTATVAALQRFVAAVAALPPAERRGTIVYRESPNGRRKGYRALLGKRDEGEDISLHADLAAAIDAELAEEGAAGTDEGGALP